MTRFLSEALRAPEPNFRAYLQRLEAACGHPNHDIRFTSEVMRDTKTKLRWLGLDPDDTTPKELYYALQLRIKADDQILTRNLRTRAATHVSAEAIVQDGIVHALSEAAGTKRYFAMKYPTLKSLLKKLPPRKAMTALGYRSLDSFLKHEPPIVALAAAWVAENEAWRKRFREQYKRLRTGDFENRRLVVVGPAQKRWRQFASQATDSRKDTLMAFKELGALVVLPLPESAPDGLVTATVCLGLHELNEITTTSVFLKLCQVRPDFGRIVQTATGGEAVLPALELDTDLSWQTVLQHTTNRPDQAYSQLLEPHVQPEDLTWHSVEAMLEKIEPSFNFWKHSGHLGLLHHDDGGPVSLHLIDAALNYCNGLPFEQRIVHYFQRSLWHKLIQGYLKPDVIEQCIAQQLQPALAYQASRA